MNAKKAAGVAAAELIKDGMTVGLGTGSTAYWAIKKIGEKIRQGLRISAIATSKESERLAREVHIPIVNFSEISRIDVTIDGADEADPELNLIKGGGGALLREKIIAAASEKLIVIVDDTKLVKKLGKFPLPVEAVSFGVENTLLRIEELGCKPEIRMTDGNERYITDNGNYIIDCGFGSIKDPERISRDLNQIPGVVENGLFINMAHKMIVGYGTGRVEVMVKNK